jgi:hypothetical protein
MVLYFYSQPDAALLSRHPAINRVIEVRQLDNGLWAAVVTLADQ